MKTLPIILTLSLFIGLIACSDDMTDGSTKRAPNDQFKPYVDLYFFNYDSLPNDPIFVQSYELDGPYLTVVAGYSGCNFEHPVELVWIHPSCGTPPLPPPTFELRHDGQGELCEMYVTDTLYFDLSNAHDPAADAIDIQFCYQLTGDEYQCDPLVLE